MNDPKDKGHSAGRSTPNKEQALRRQAEEKAWTMEGLDGGALGPAEIQRQLHELQVHQIELEMQNEELRRAEKKREALRARYADLYDSAPVGYVTVSERGLILNANLTVATLLGVNRGLLSKRPLTGFILPQDQDIYYRHRQQLFEGGGAQVCELRLVPPGGVPFWARLESTVVRDTENGTPVCHAVISDITERKAREARETLMMRVLEAINRGGGNVELIGEILHLIKESTGFEAVGLRLREGEDYPYYVTSGFAPGFVEAERHLCARDQTGELVRDAAGSPLLECMCGNVICGRFDPSKPFFTKRGSFWTNGTTQLLASTTEQDRQSRTRNRCNGAGYESVALIPLRAADEVIGLLQLNDHRPDAFTLEMIEFLEGLGASIGIALAHQRAEEALHELNATLENRVAQRTSELEYRARQLQKLALELSEVEDRERKRLAEILHDDLQQLLVGAQFHLALLKNQAAQDSPQQAIAVAVDDMLKDAVAKSRSLSHELSPAVLDRNDLAEAITWLARQMRARHGLTVHVDAPDGIGLQSKVLRVFLFRAAQEMLFNVIKHAGVDEARIRVRRRGRCMCVSVSDRGHGFNSQERRETAGFGLFGIRERVELLGGRMKIKSAVGKGSIFHIVVPDGGASSQGVLIDQEPDGRPKKDRRA